MSKLFLLIFCVVQYFVWTLASQKGNFGNHGLLHYALYSKLISCDHNRDLYLDVSQTIVYFYDFPKDAQESYPISEAPKVILNYKNLVKTRKFIVFVPGYKSTISKNTSQKVRDTFKTLSNSYLIILDHFLYTNDNDGRINSYERSVKYVHYIGKAIGNMLAELSKGGIDTKNIHCIGHSLGSQMLSHAGEVFQNVTGKKLARITGLDPAGPCFTKSSVSEQIRSGVADYVEIYHCNAGGLGTASILGDVDFFVNEDGAIQPHCRISLISRLLGSQKIAKCSHAACINLFLETVNNPKLYLATKCGNYNMFTKGNCSKNDVTVAGFWNPGDAKGVFYFTTSK